MSDERIRNSEGEWIPAKKPVPCRIKNPLGLRFFSCNGLYKDGFHPRTFTVVEVTTGGTVSTMDLFRSRAAAIESARARTKNTTRAQWLAALKKAKAW